MKPSIGRIIHCKMDSKSECLAAIITRIQPNGNIVATAFIPSAMPITVIAPEQKTEEETMPSWHWPERVD